MRAQSYVLPTRGKNPAWTVWIEFKKGIRRMIDRYIAVWVQHGNNNIVYIVNTIYIDDTITCDLCVFLRLASKHSVGSR